jgi:hypothetical protein
LNELFKNESRVLFSSGGEYTTSLRKKKKETRSKL